ncbi:MAG TPA: hypothetical protein VFZ76_06470 [Anaerolineales bacterium]
MKQFNPDRVAYYEANGWRAYYDRKWSRLLKLIISMAQEEFNIPFPISLLAAYYVTRASAAWVPVDHDERVVRGYYEKFYRLARRYSGLSFDPAEVAGLELKYNDVHRRLAGKPDKTEFIETMVELHSALFCISLDEALESAELRVKANNTVDLIASGASSDPEGDWERIESYLTQCYKSIEQARTLQQGAK